MEERKVPIKQCSHTFTAKEEHILYAQKPSIVPWTPLCCDSSKKWYFLEMQYSHYGEELRMARLPVMLGKAYRVTEDSYYTAMCVSVYLSEDNEIEVPINCIFVLIDKPMREAGHSYSFYLYDSLMAWEPCTELTKVGVNKAAIFCRIQSTTTD